MTQYYYIKSIYLNFKVYCKYFFSILILPFAYFISILIKKNKHKKKVFLSLIKYTQTEGKTKYKNNYRVIDSIKEAGYDFKFINIDINDKLYKKFFYNVLILIKIIKLNPKYIYFFSDIQPSGNYPNIIVFYLISKIIKCKTICISHDFNWKINDKYLELHKKLFDTTIAQPYAYFKNHKKILFADPWYGLNELIISPKNKRNIDILFVGRKGKNQSRNTYINKLLKDGFNLKVYGPGYGKTLSFKEYKRLYSKTKIALNFTGLNKNPNLKSLKHPRGRALEVLAFGCLLLEENNKSTNLLLKKNKHFIEFSNYKNLKSQLRYYLLNFDKYGKKIALAGQKHYINNYSPKSMWNKIFIRL